MKLPRSERAGRTSRTGQARAGWLAACLGAALGACGSDPGSDGSSDDLPPWVHLAHGPGTGQSPDFAKITATWAASLPSEIGLSVSPGPEPDTLWLTRQVPARAWQPTKVPGLYKTPRVLSVVGQRTDHGPTVGLTHAGQELRFLHDAASVQIAQDTLETLTATPDTFFEYERHLYAATGEPPGAVRHQVFVRWRETSPDVQRFGHGRFAGEGLALLPGTARELALPAGEARVLRFGTVAESALLRLPPSHSDVHFRVLLDDELLLEHVQPATLRGSLVRHALPLAAGAAGTLRFEVSGPPALTAFLAPLIEPQGPDDSRERRPDIVIFLADTFRADNMALYGGAPGLTPNLDEFADQSLRFLRTWSPASWTLPAHASLFSGVFPRQHDALGKSYALGERATTIAELLSAGGYRTGAITDASLVSHRTGLAQGFEWWDEMHIDLASTLERAEAFLAADDGRPVFLFVHSYAVHEPYLVSESTRDSHGSRLRLDGQSTDLRKAILGGYKQLGDEAPVPESLHRTVRHYQDLYRGGVVDLDRAFGSFLEVLERSPVGSAAYTLFTSDHGEAFREHGHMGHGRGVWEEDVRIPLLIRGPGLLPADVLHAASLVDLPRSVAGMAGLEPSPAWLGSSLLELSAERPAFSFVASQGKNMPLQVGMVAGSRKLIAVSAVGSDDIGTVSEAYDLEADPDERVNLMRDPPAWVGDLAKRLTPLARALLIPIYAAEARVLSAEQQQQLKMMGYADF